MKSQTLSSLLLLLAGLLTAIPAFTQVRIGLRGGVNDPRGNSSPLTLIDQLGTELLNIGLDRDRVGLTGGLVVQARLGTFLIQPEVLFSSNTYDYRVRDLATPDAADETLEERYLYLDIPLLLGWKLGPLRLQAGPEAHIYLNSTSDLVDIDYYRENIDNFTFGWLGNVGIDVWNLMLDLRFEGNLSALGSSFQIGTQTFRFDERPSRWVFSLGYLF